MQTMQEQPGRWRGCFVVVAAAPAENSTMSEMLSPRTAAFASASSPDGGSPSFEAELSGTLRGFLVSEGGDEQNQKRNYIRFTIHAEIYQHNHAEIYQHNFRERHEYERREV